MNTQEKGKKAETVSLIRPLKISENLPYRWRGWAFLRAQALP